ncbi:uncharacterized protein [Montipora capricornis]|uniref:uncharacterized protein isoform X2 n=1 Tax=Montipora capricornis TaxID=246305 RepID=UPI0035F13A8C
MALLPLNPLVILSAIVILSVAFKATRVLEKVQKSQVKGTQVRKDFWCPTCKNVTQEACDNTPSLTICPSADSCVALSAKGTFARICANTKFRESLTRGCKNVGYNMTACSRKRKYRVSWCGEPGCKAEMVSDFWCPTCQNSTQESCDAASSNTTCPKANFCIAFQDEKFFARKCVNKEFLDQLTNGCLQVSATERECNRKRKYHVTWCKQPGCKAEVSGLIPSGGEQPRETDLAAKRRY